MNEIQVLVVEDEPLIAENLAQYLNNHDFRVCGIAYDDEEALQLLETNVPDAAILDINLGTGIDGIELAAIINERFSIPFIFLTSYADKATIEKAKQVKPWGYIVKPFNEQTVLANIEIAVSNFAKANNHSQPLINIHKLNQHLLSPVSEREFEVLEQIYNGMTNLQIAALLNVSVNTVKKHINNSYLKLDAVSRSSAMVRLRELMQK